MQKRRQLLTTLSCSCIILLCVALFLFAGSTSTQAQEEPVRMNRPNTHSSVVCIYGTIAGTDSSKIGNGFVINEKGYIVTTKHLVNRLQEPFKVRPMCGEPQYTFYNAKLVDSCDVHDCAVIRITGSTFNAEVCPPCTLADDSTLFFPGTDVEIRAYDCLASEEEDALITGNIMSMTENNIRVHNGGFKKGYSGSPLFIRGSRVVIGCLISGGQIYKPKIKFDDKEFLVPEESQIMLFPPYHAVPVNIIKDLLVKDTIEFHQGRWESQGRSPYPGNPDPEKDHRDDHLGMLRLILSLLEDVIWMKRSQFEGKLDSDILLETYWETSSFRRKLGQSKQDRTIARENAEFFFIKGLAMKATRERGFKAGMEYFSRALYEDSTFADPCYQIALYHLRCTNDSAEIINHLNKGLEQDPYDGELLRTMGMFYLNYNIDDSARVYFETASEHLNENDARIPFYIGLTFDPYWAMISPLGSWTEQFKAKNDRKPAFPEIQQFKKDFLSTIANYEDSIKTAFAFYDSSRNLAPWYIRPLNSTVWTLTNEVLLGKSTHVQTLREKLRQMEEFVEYGLIDPRFFNTLALGYASLRNCKRAQEYLDMSLERVKSIKLSPKYTKDLILENQNVERVCELFITTTYK